MHDGHLSTPHTNSHDARKRGFFDAIIAVCRIEVLGGPVCNGLHALGTSLPTLWPRTTNQAQSTSGTPVAMARRMTNATFDFDARFYSRLCAALSLLSLVGCDHASSSSVSKAEPVDAAAVDAAVASSDASIGTDAADAAPSVEVTVTATVNGRPFHAKGAAEHRFWFVADGGRGNAGMSLLIGQYPAMCSAPRVPLSPTLFFYLRSDQSEVVPGTYPLVDDFVLGGRGPAPQATLNVITMSSRDCGIDTLDQSTSGTITITKSGAGIIEGMFDAVLSRNGAIRGNFRITPCTPWDPRADNGTAMCVL